jgi:eukaryotic-like serine/threonine-protein kinase
LTLETGTPIGKYRVRRKLAEGGMAEIYLASVQGPEGFEKEVVIKRIRSFLADDPDFVQMFIAEARLASRLNHANIVQIFDFDKHQDTFYLAMEYVRGRSLWDVRRRSREKMMPVPPTLVAHLGADVARGLHYAHMLKEKGKPLGLVHRDVTPHNVLLSYEGSVKLTDFGIAKAGNKLTSPGTLKGKFAYMSPEQARGEPVDARTDVFALGIVLWEMLTGARLFDAEGDVQVLRAVQHSPIAPPARLNPEVHQELDQVVMRALERERERRFSSAHELERALRQHILKHADSIEATDVGLYLRRLFADELQVPGEGQEGTTSGLLPPSAPPTRAPTAVMPSRSSGPAVPAAAASADEDLHAPTWVVPDRQDLRPPTLAARPTLRLEPSELPGAAWPGLQPAPGAASSAALAVSLEPCTSAEVPVVAEPLPRAPSRPVAAAPLSTVSIKKEVGVRPRLALLWGGVLLLAVASAVGVLARSSPSLAVDELAAAPYDEAAAAPCCEEPGAQAAAELEPGPPEALLEPPQDSAASAPSDAEAAAELAASPPATGGLLLNITPWADVFIDGKPRGDIAGKRELELPAGKYVVRLQHPRRTLERVVTIRPGRRQPIVFDAFRD